MKNVSGENEENAHITAFGEWTKMDPEENEYIVANRCAAGTDLESLWCARECVYSVCQVQLSFLL